MLSVLRGADVWAGACMSQGLGGTCLAALRDRLVADVLPDPLICRLSRVATREHQAVLAHLPESLVEQDLGSDGLRPHSSSKVSEAGTSLYCLSTSLFLEGHFTKKPGRKI